MSARVASAQRSLPERAARSAWLTLAALAVLASTVEAGPAAAGASSGSGAASSRAPSSRGSASASASGSAAARSAYDLELLIVAGDNGKGGIDPRLAGLAQLKNPPFSAYKSYRLVATKRLPLSDVPVELALPDGGRLSAQLMQVLSDDQLRLRASFSPGAKKGVKAPEPTLLQIKARLGRPLIIAGRTEKDGVLAFVLTARKR